jgi:hypothetical protein
MKGKGGRGISKSGKTEKGVGAWLWIESMTRETPLYIYPIEDSCCRLLVES